MKRFTVIIAVLLAAATTTVAQAEPLRYALGLFETGAKSHQISRPDFMRGGSGEVSRYQIMPDVWKRYSESKEFHDPDVAWAVAEKILEERLEKFRKRMERDPNPTEMYLLWNKPGHFSAVGYSLTRVDSHYFNRAQRFGNLYRAVEISYEKRKQAHANAGQTVPEDGDPHRG